MSKTAASNKPLCGATHRWPIAHSAGSGPIPVPLPCRAPMFFRFEECDRDLAEEAFRVFLDVNFSCHGRCEEVADLLRARIDARRARRMHDRAKQSPSSGNLGNTDPSCETRSDCDSVRNERKP